MHSTKGVKKRIAPVTQAHYRLRSTKLRRERGLNQSIALEDADMGEAPEVEEALTAPQEPATHQRPPKQISPEVPMQALHSPGPALENQYQPPLTDRDTPPTTPTHESPQSQLSLELQSHVSDAVTSGTAQLKTTGDEVSELVSMISQKIYSWEEKSLQGAATLGRDVRKLVLNFSKTLAGGHPSDEKRHQSHPTKSNSYAEATRMPPSKTHKATPKSHATVQSEKPPCVFLCLPQDHPACQASPYATICDGLVQYESIGRLSDEILT